MKAYFILRNFFQDSLTAESAGIDLRTYKIDGVETLTPDFFIDTQSNYGVPADDFSYCSCHENGTVQVVTLDTPNSFNPFSINFGTEYALESGALRGLPIGTLNGHDYGLGVLNFGVDVPRIKNGEGNMINGAFFIEIDFTKSVEIEFDIVTNIIDGHVYENPQILRKYTIIWDVLTCKKTFRYFDVLTNESYDESVNGFLAGVWDKNHLDDNAYIDFSLIPCGVVDDSCPFKERTRSFAMFVTLPEPIEDLDEVFKECCYNHFVLADENSTDDFKNDYSSFFHQKQTPNETVDFVLVHLETNDEYDLNDGTFGEYFNFGSLPTNSNLKGYLLKWKNVLSEIGEGNFKVLKRITIAGSNIELPSITFTLQQFTTFRADKTTRMDVVMNGFLQKNELDFTGTKWKHSIRVPGFFGRREPKFEEDFIVNRDFEKKEISSKQTNEFKFQTNLIPDCLTDEIFDFMLLANDIFMNDYNLNNHSYKFVKFGVKLSSNEGTGYHTKSRKAQLNLVFNDKFDNNLKRNFG